MGSLKAVKVLCLFLLAATLSAQPEPVRLPEAALDAYDVAWDKPGTSSLDSMPLGNGDIGLNVWTESNGDIVFYISKTDAWSENTASPKGLLKLGRVRVQMTPALDLKTFSQTLHLGRAEVLIRAGQTELRVGVDANRPVIHVEVDNAEPRELSVAFESLRPTEDKDVHTDTVFSGQPNGIAWYYRNQNKKIQQLSGLTFGALIQGDGLISSSDVRLKTAQPTKRQSMTIGVHTAQKPTAEAWLQDLKINLAKADAVALETARREHQNWWRDFWDRSWIFATGDEAARQVTQGYILQRYISACAGRGAYPIKFNGSIFTMDWLKKEKVKGVASQRIFSPDERDWGGRYWFQNTRATYWPMLQSGDFDMMLPLFRMYQNQLPGNARQVSEYYKHEGAYFYECQHFYGGLPKVSDDSPGAYHVHCYTPILELSAMMLDYYAYTADREFVKQTLLPVAEAGVIFFDQHFKRENGKLRIDPANSIEMYFKTRNPITDVAGLRWVLSGLLALPKDLTQAEQRERWQRLLGEIPEIPACEINGVKRLQAAEVTDNISHNMENPELYAIYPFRLFGIGKPDLELARNSFAGRKFKVNGCWRQDGIQAALLGDSATATQNVKIVLTNKCPQVRFPAFWAHGSDYVPDQDNGGNGLHTLQLMLLQGEGRKVYLLPAWPTEWNADFRLHAPLNTVITGRVESGKIIKLDVTPPERRSDIIITSVPTNK